MNIEIPPGINESNDFIPWATTHLLIHLNKETGKYKYLFIYLVCKSMLSK